MTPTCAAATRPTTRRRSSTGRASTARSTGRIDVTRDTALRSRRRADRRHRQSRQPEHAGRSRTRCRSTPRSAARPASTQRFNRVEVTAKGSGRPHRIPESQFTDGTTSSNADRNYNHYGAHAAHQLRADAGAQAVRRVRRRHARARSARSIARGVQRDSDGCPLKVGTTFEFSRKLTGEIAVG